MAARRRAVSSSELGSPIAIRDGDPTSLIVFGGMAALFAYAALRSWGAVYGHRRTGGAKRQRDGFIERLKLMREGNMETRKIEGDSHINTTSISISEAEQSLAALERKIARLEAAGASRT